MFEITTSHLNVLKTYLAQQQWLVTSLKRVNPSQTKEFVISVSDLSRRKKELSGKSCCQSFNLKIMCHEERKYMYIYIQITSSSKIPDCKAQKRRSSGSSQSRQYTEIRIIATSGVKALNNTNSLQRLLSSHCTKINLSQNLLGLSRNGKMSRTRGRTAISYTPFAFFLTPSPLQSRKDLQTRVSNTGMSAEMLKQ